MRFLTFGGGSLGSLVSARLAERHDVTLVGRPDHVAAIRASGLSVTGRTELHQRSIHAVTEVDPNADPPDVVLVTTKAYDTISAVKALAPFVHRAIFVSLQNGLGNEEVMAGTVDRVLGAVINQGVTFLSPGAVFHAGEGETELGPFHGTDPEDADRLAAAFCDAGLPAQAVPDIRARIWLKAVLNAAVNPVTALLGLKTGQLLDHPELRDAVDAVVQGWAVGARAAGVTLEPAAILEKIWSVAEATRDNKSSMLQDLERGRRTEIDAINGAILKHAATAGIAAPNNELFFRLIRAAERNNLRAAP